MMLTITLR